MKCCVFLRQSDWTCNISLSLLTINDTRNEPMMPFAIHMLYAHEFWVLCDFPKVHGTHIPWKRDSQAHLGKFMKSWSNGEGTYNNVLVVSNTWVGKRTSRRFIKRTAPFKFVTRRMSITFLHIFCKFLSLCQWLEFISIENISNVERKLMSL